jgi:hypothetical protein
MPLYGDSIYPVSKFDRLTTQGDQKMRKQSTRTMNLFTVLAGSAFVLTAGMGHGALAQTAETDQGFNTASLQGTYIYVNSNSDVASFGAVTFNGNGEVNMDLEISLPCADPSPNCSRNVVDSVGSGTYSVEPDGTGLATVGLSTGEAAYSFIISEFTMIGGQPVATKISAVGRTGGLAGQVIAPTWTRR